MSRQDLQQAHRRLALRLVLLTAGMFGFGFALAPLYDVFCTLTGLNGKPSATAALPPAAQDEDATRLVTVELLAIPGTTAGWDFRPQVSRLTVHPGRTYSTAFLAHNPAEQAQVVRAVPSVAPGVAARHFHKTECFCFTSQRFAAGEERALPLRFAVDPALPREIGTLSLAYTLYLVDAEAEL